VSVRTGAFPNCVEATLHDGDFAPTRVDMKDGSVSHLELHPPEGVWRAYVTLSSASVAQAVVVHASGFGFTPTRQQEAIVHSFFDRVAEHVVKGCGNG
jgi:hypothetical protein